MKFQKARSQKPEESSLPPAPQIPKDAADRMINTEMRETYRMMELERNGVKGLSDEEIMDKVAEAYDEAWDTLAPDSIEWAVGHDTHQNMRALAQQFNIVTYGYAGITNVNQERLADMLGWDKVPLRIGRVSYIEWIIFIVSQIYRGAEAHKEQAG